MYMQKIRKLQYRINGKFYFKDFPNLFLVQLIPHTIKHVHILDWTVEDVLGNISLVLGIKFYVIHSILDKENMK